MKTMTLSLLAGACALGLLLASATAQSPNSSDPAPATLTNAPAAEPLPPVDDGGAPVPAPAPADPLTPDTHTTPAVAPAADGAGPVAEPSPEAWPAAPAAPAELIPEGERGLRLNFRGAPLEMVLNYLSEAAGFIIVPEVDVRGRVDVWSNQPLTREEALDVLNQVLSRNGFAILRNDRTLTVVTKETAKKRNIAVHSGYEPEDIPRNEVIVTQIIPVRFINAVQVAKDLQPLLPAEATMTANEGGNALVITDTQINIRRMAEIIKALDTTVSSLSAVRVFPLRYADAKTVSTMIRDVFQSTDASRGGDRSRRFGFFGGGPPGEGGRDSRGSGDTGGRPGAGRVVAAADERGNSVVVSAPDDMMPTIEELVTSVDVSVEDVTEVRVFRLHYSDPVEMADLLANLFPDPTSNDTRGSVRFGGFGGPPGMDLGRSRGGSTTDQSDRLKKQTRVIAVPDQRTSSVVVSASRDLMGQIANMVEELDANPARKQKVFVFELKNADVRSAEEILRNLFEGQNSRGAGNSTQDRGALENRATQMQNQQINTGIGSSFGGGNASRQGR